MNQTPASAKNPRTARVLMFDVSLPWANFWYDAFNVMLFVGAFAVAVGTYGSIKMGAVKERFSDERTTLLETQTEQARAQLGTAQADIAKANAKIAEANARVAEAEKQNLDLRAKIASRRITGEQHKILVDELSKSPGLFDIAVMGDPESSLFASDILKTLADAGWTVGARELPLGEIWTGLVLFQTDDPSAKRILDALLKAKIPFSIGDDAHKRPKATIMVGNKPSLF
jgi:hypothetical protein